jgi:hypothetical protein
LWKNTSLTAAIQVCGIFRPGGTKKATHWWTPEIGNMIKEKEKIMEEIPLSRNSGDF